MPRPRAAAAASLAGVAALAGWLAVVRPRGLVVRDVDVRPPGWPAALDGLRVVLVGDLHVGCPSVPLSRAHAVVDRVLGLRPELVLLVGDHVADVSFGSHVEAEQVAALLGRLGREVPTVGVLGNHDWYAGGHRMREALEAVGLPTLEESAVALPLRGTTLWVAGVGDDWERTPDVAAALAHVPAGAPVLLLAHNPDTVVDVPPEVALTVSGHTHGGQVAWRGRPFHSVSPRSGNRWLLGGYEVAAPDGGVRRLEVTAGVGTSLIPLRSVPPELVVLTLHA